MALIRMTTLESMIQNTRVFAKYVHTKSNGKADALSRLDIKHFRKLDPTMEDSKTEIPAVMWPMSKIWVH